MVNHLPAFVNEVCKQATLTVETLDAAILHQASHHALGVVQDLIGFDPDKMVLIFKQFGNQIATSIPHALDRGVSSGAVKRGDKVLLLGTSAGISFGGMVIEY